MNHHPNDWAAWLSTLTHETTERGIARRIGVSHTTVQRWVTKGPPPARIMPLAIRFGGNPVDAAIRAGIIARDDIARLNWSEIVAYAPTEVLTLELHDRARRLAAQGDRLERT